MHKRVFYSGVFILVAGLIAGVLIYVFSTDEPTIEIANRQAYEFQIERIGGKAEVYVVRFNEWLSSLWHGKQLGITLGLLAIVIALVCFWAADQIAES